MVQMPEQMESMRSIELKREKQKSIPTTNQL